MQTAPCAVNRRCYLPIDFQHRALQPEVSIEKLRLFKGAVHETTPEATELIRRMRCALFALICAEAELEIRCPHGTFYLDEPLPHAGWKSSARNAEHGWQKVLKPLGRKRDLELCSTFSVKPTLRCYLTFLLETWRLAETVAQSARDEFPQMSESANQLINVILATVATRYEQLVPQLEAF